MLFQLWKDIRSADIVHIQGIFSAPTPLGLFYSTLFNKKVLLVLHDNFKTMDSFTAEDIEKLCKGTADYMAEGKLGKIMMPLRAALTGRTTSPSLTHSLLPPATL